MKYSVFSSFQGAYIVLCSQTFQIWPFPLRVSRFYIIPLQLYHPRDKSASKRFKIGFLVLSGWNILFFHHSRVLRLGLWGPLALVAPPCLLLCCCLSPGIKSGEISFRFGDVVLRKKEEKAPSLFSYSFFSIVFFLGKNYLEIYSGKKKPCNLLIYMML